MIFLDTETCGFHGMIVLIQWARDDGEIHLHDVWKKPISETLALIDEICTEDVVGFNLAFDWFHIVKLYTTFIEFINRGGDPEELPEDHIDELAECELAARDLDLTLKPKRAMDLMLHARRGPYQTLMGRADIKIKNIPALMCRYLKDELEKRIPLDAIYFSAKKDKTHERWQVADRKQNPEFKDVVLKFKASGALKVLAHHALKVEKTLLMSEIGVEKAFLPIELGFAPCAKLITSQKGHWTGKIKRKGQFVVGKSWPGVIHHHIAHWCYNSMARQYATDDVTYTRDLWKYFGKPEPGDTDSELACCVACVRWRGYKVNLDLIREQREKALAKLKQTPITSAKSLAYITEPMEKTDRLGFGTLTGKVILEKMVADPLWACDCTEETGVAVPGCSHCEGKGLHPAAARAKAVLEARFAKKEIELYDKILLAGRLHASFIVIGALSSRMSGSDGLNSQGIKRTKDVRRCFELAYDGFDLWGGDFDAFEVVLADAAYHGALREDLTTLYDCFNCGATGKDKKGECEDCGGTGQAPRKIHGLFACDMYGKTYEQVMATKGKSPDLYSLGKNGVFSMIYGGDWGTLVRKYNVDEESAQRAFKVFIGKRPGIKKAQQQIVDDFGSMRQPGGLGTKVEWNDPKEYVESLFGDRRYFTLENQISKALYALGCNPPKAWRDIKIKCVRRIDRGPQLVSGATASALYGAAFGIQGSVVRAATNHVIQSSGARTTKAVQRAIWDLQPCGAHPIRVLPCNVHDEILCPAKPPYVEAVRKAVHDTVESFRPRVPLIKFEFKRMKNWAEK